MSLEDIEKNLSKEGYTKCTGIERNSKGDYFRVYEAKIDSEIRECRVPCDESGNPITDKYEAEWEKEREIRRATRENSTIKDIAMTPFGIFVVSKIRKEEK